MPLTRRILKAGSWVAIPVPRDLAKMMGLEAKDTVENAAEGPNLFKVRKASVGAERP